MADIIVHCPCCNAKLTVDTSLERIVAHDPPPRKIANAPDFDRASQLLKEQAEKREAVFRQSEKDEKIKGSVLERKFEEALKKNKDLPPTRPTRDIDL